MLYSARIRMRADHVKRSGRCSLILDATLGSASLRCKLPLHLDWYPDRFAPATGECLPRHRSDIECRDLQLLLGQKMARANQIFAEYRLGQRPLSVEAFQREFDNPLPRTDFLEYYQHKIDERLRQRQIEQSTYDVAARCLGRLREFVGGEHAQLPFNTLDRKWAYRFDAWLKNKYSNGINTRWARHKDVTTYLNMARLDEIAFVHPYDYFKKKSTDGSWKPISPASAQKLLAYYEQCPPGTAERQALQKYLTACSANLRISDLNTARPENLVGEELVYVQHKNRRFGRSHRLPLTPMALHFIQDALAENDGDTIFSQQTAQAGNKILKRIAAKLEIPERLHFHSGRETFATEFLSAGGQLQVLQNLMGHSKIASTMRYVHVKETDKRTQVVLVDKMFVPPA